MAADPVHPVRPKSSQPSVSAIARHRCKTEPAPFSSAFLPPDTSSHRFPPCQKAKMRHKAHLIRSAAGPVLRSITPRPQKGDRWTASVIQGVIQRDFRIQHLRNRATRFGFIDDLIESRFINAWQRNSAGQRYLVMAKPSPFLSSETSAVVSILSGG